MIEIQALTKTYRDRQALQELTLAIQPGELFLYLGPNGAGKTTTLRMLAGLLRPSSGTMRVAGCDPLRQAQELRRRVGYLSDDFLPYEHLTGFEYLQFVADMHSIDRTTRDQRAERLLDLFDLTAAAARMTREYSHGMRKKLGLASALIHEPQVLLLDEPTSELDPRSAQLVHRVLRGLADQGCCILVSTHILGRAEKLCDRVGMLLNGKLVLCGAPDELLEGEPHESLEELFLEVTGRTDRGKIDAYLADRSAGAPPAP